MRASRWSTVLRGLRDAGLGVAVFAIAVAATGLAGQLRPVTDRVYSTQQAARGQTIYTAQCAECHGSTLEGSSGPPLTGSSFLSNWSGRPLVGLVDKIQKT